MSAPKDCATCRSLATHEDCEKDGGCLTLPEDSKLWSNLGYAVQFRYRHWIESNPMEQMNRLHALELKGERNIVLGPGEAEVNVKQTPQEASQQLHSTAEQCGYVVSNLTHDAGDGKRTLTVFKDFGPFKIEWEGDRLARILQGKKERIFWQAEKYSWQV